MSEPWTPEEVNEAEKWFHLREMVEANSERSAPLSAVLRALATIRALQAEIAELKTELEQREASYDALLQEGGDDL